MKRYYYTDPLAAAWMAKHFGMRFYEGLEPFEDGEPFEIEQYGILKEAARQAWNECYSKNPYVYIHPDSLHLLEPNKATDHIIHDENEQGEILRSRIIQRNGLAFMWPESEDE